MIGLRKQCPEVGWGEWQIVSTRSPSVLALLFSWRGTSLLCVHNFAPEPRDVAIRLRVEGGDRLANLVDSSDSRVGGGGAHRIALEPYASRWYRVGGLESALRRDQA